MVDLDVITKVLRKFLTAPRNPRYLEKPEYKHMQERNKEIYLSSCWYKSHWSWKRVLSYFKNMCEGKKYFICGLPYQLSISEGLLMEDQVRDEMSEDDFDPVAWSKRKLLPLVVMLMKNSVNPLTKGCGYSI